jgi:hypothetical protein
MQDPILDEGVAESCGLAVFRTLQDSMAEAPHPPWPMIRSHDCFGQFAWCMYFSPLFMLEKLKVGILGLYDDLYVWRPPPTPTIRTRLAVHFLSSTSAPSPGQCTPRLPTLPEPEPWPTHIRRPPIIPKPIHVPERWSTSLTSPNAVRFLPANREPVRSFLSPRSFEPITSIPELLSLRFGRLLRLLFP